jgi:hypothetical protein
LPEKLFRVKVFEPTESTVPNVAGPAFKPPLQDPGRDPGCGEWVVPALPPASVVVRVDAAAVVVPAETTATAP